MPGTILVVEDNEMNRRLMVELLNYHGYEVLEARNGAQALLLSRSQQIDLILMDMQMSIMNGYEAVKALRADERTAGIKIIAVTSFALTEEKERILATGVDGFVTKPIDTRTFPVIVQQMIGRRQGEQERKFNKGGSESKPLNFELLETLPATERAPKF